MVSRIAVGILILACVVIDGRSLAQEPPVPGFGEEDERPPVPGFGTTGELFSVRITDQDRRTVDERFRRYDRNQDGFLSREEMSRSSGSSRLEKVWTVVPTMLTTDQPRTRGLPIEIVGGVGWADAKP